MLTKEQIHFFNDNGYLLMRNFISSGTRKILLQAVEQIKNRVNSHPHKYSTRYTFFSNSEWDTWGVNEIFGPELYEDSFGDFLGDPTLLSIIKELLDCEELRFWVASLLWAPEKVNYDLYWHRDDPDSAVYTPSGKANHVQFNVALTKDTSFWVIPGSHKRPLNELEQLVERSKEIVSLPDQINVECNPGDIIFMNAWTLHRGSCSSTDVRRTLHMNVQPKNETYGGHTSQSWMKDSNHLNRMNSNVKQLILNLVEWDNLHPLSEEEISQEKVFFDRIKKHQANKDL
ncbi:phytanoyl-CoA dioxygenase family protein [Bacillus mycoides]|uniref:phytanoyl-CoA dioxygenase family protein n=1 Tax=Bacillus mycoides TaxID=1405 RepID=UPI003D1C0762